LMSPSVPCLSRDLRMRCCIRARALHTLPTHNVPPAGGTSQACFPCIKGFWIRALPRPSCGVSRPKTSVPGQPASVAESVTDRHVRDYRGLVTFSLWHSLEGSDCWGPLCARLVDAPVWVRLIAARAKYNMGSRNQWVRNQPAQDDEAMSRDTPRSVPSLKRTHARTSQGRKTGPASPHRRHYTQAADWGMAISDVIHMYVPMYAHIAHIALLGVALKPAATCLPVGHGRPCGMWLQAPLRPPTVATIVAVAHNRS
jgi:hypothetical protein